MLPSGNGLVTIGREASSRVPVLAPFQRLEYGTERPLPRGLVVLKGPGLPRELGDPARQPGTTLRGEDVPAEETVRALEPRVFSRALEQILQRCVQRFGFLQGQLDLRRTGFGGANESSPGRCGPA